MAIEIKEKEFPATNQRIKRKGINTAIATTTTSMSIVPSGKITETKTRLEVDRTGVKSTGTTAAAQVPESRSPSRSSRLNRDERRHQSRQSRARSNSVSFGYESYMIHNTAHNSKSDEQQNKMNETTVHGAYILITIPATGKRKKRTLFALVDTCISSSLIDSEKVEEANRLVYPS